MKYYIIWPEIWNNLRKVAQTWWKLDDLSCSVLGCLSGSGNFASYPRVSRVLPRLGHLATVSCDVELSEYSGFFGGSGSVHWRFRGGKFWHHHRDSTIASWHMSQWKENTWLFFSDIRDDISYPSMLGFFHKPSNVRIPIKTTRISHGK